jgi:hypothetical protein
MSGVYNRKLFRQAPARDELRKLGGIMSSSEELMQEALRTADQAPRPAGLGTMAMPMQPPQMPMMQQPMPMQQPMGMMPPQSMGIMPPQKMPMEAQPLPQMTPQPMQQEPAYMPPQVPGSVQPQGFAAGGMAMGYSLKSEQDTADAAAAADPTLSATPAEAIEADVLDKAQGLLPLLDTEDPEVIAAEILSSAAAQGVEPTGDTQVDLARIYQNLTGDPAAFEKNIDNLNRGIIGAAIGAGTSARATENISRGLLVGLEGAKDTEERRLADARTLQLAEIQARTAEAKKRGTTATGAESRDYRNPVDAFQDAYQAVMNAGEFDLEIPEGMTREDYAEQVATALIQRSYTPDQLAGSPFEGMTGPAAPPPEAASGAAEDMLNQARAAIVAGADEAAIRERLESLGIDPESL